MVFIANNKKDLKFLIFIFLKKLLNLPTKAKSMGNVHSYKKTQSLALNWPIEQLPGLSLEDSTKLTDCGITTTIQLLQQTLTQNDKQVLATKLQLNIKYINKWVALADLARIPSVGCQYCGLLLHAGIGSVVQLAQTPVHKLHQQILRLQVATLQRRDLCPPASEMQIWIKQAQNI